MRPARFAVCALLLFIVCLGALGARSGRWGAEPPTRWDLQDQGFWLRDPGDRWVIFPGVDLLASEVAGLGLSFSATGGDLPLAVLWRRAGDDTEYSKAVAHSLSRSWAYVDLSSEPEWRGTIDALGVRSLDDAAMQLQAVTLEVPGVWAGLARAWRSLWVCEIFDDSAVNFLDGAQILTLGFSTLLGGLVLVFLSVELFRAARSRQLAWRDLGVLALGVWVVLDLRFTYDLAANARFDRIRYPSLAVADAVVSTDPYPPFADLVAAVEEHVPADAKVAFLTDNWTYQIKSRYVLFPRPVVKTKNLKRHADYVVLFLKDNATYSPRRQLLKVGDETTIAKRVFEVADVGAIYEVIRPTRTRRTRPSK